MDIDLTAIIICKRPASISTDVIRQRLERIAPGLPFEEALDGTAVGGGGARGAVVICDGVMMAVLEVAAPLPLESLIYGPLPTLFWQTAAQDLAGHSAHVRVMVVNPEKSGKSITEQARALTLLAAAVCNAVEAIGVLWCASDHLMSAGRFVQITTTPKDQGQMLSAIWVRLFVAQTEAGLVVATHGLAAFTGTFELEFAPTKRLDLSTLATRAMQFSHFLITGVMTLKPGDVAGPENFAVTEGRSSFEDRLALHLAMPARS
ncbi:hypothetical protein [Bradyrhizobium sp. 2TAF24]|uniref:hypothetical protein n=1 Tax=Bradyrhizobium sp. 2TAF24 TaxID=3233011 RepID=UPI003F921A9B